MILIKIINQSKIKKKKQVKEKIITNAMKYI